MVEVDINLKNELSDLIILNKKGMIQKIRENEVVNEIGTNFLFTKLDDSNYGLPIAIIIYDLYDRSIWQSFLIPEYREYIDRDYNTNTSGTTR